MVEKMGGIYMYIVPCLYHSHLSSTIACLSCKFIIKTYRNNATEILPGDIRFFLTEVEIKMENIAVKSWLA